MKILENKVRRIVKSENYNTIFDKKTGVFVRGGKTVKDDPKCSPMPEIADIEISSGKCHNSCKFCYKQNSSEGKLHNMTFEEFKTIFHKLALTTVKVIYEDGTVKEGEYNTSFDCWDYALMKSDIQNYLNEKLTKMGFKVKNILVYNKGLLSQIAFGITSPYDNPDFFKMMEYARSFDVIPNYTINGQDMTDKVAERTTNLCGACAISILSDKEKSYDAVEKLSKQFIDLNQKIRIVQTDKDYSWLTTQYWFKFKDDILSTELEGMFEGDYFDIVLKDYIEQNNLTEDETDELLGNIIKKRFKINFHIVAMEDIFDLIMQTMKDVKTDKRLKGLTAIVLLKYKPKGTNAGKFKQLSKEHYQEIFDYAEENKIGIGFDSCSAPVFMESIKNKENSESLEMLAEPCESTLFSIYINSYGETSPCSFCENEGEWTEGISVLKCHDFISDVWNNERIKNFREKLLNNDRHCPMFNLED